MLALILVALTVALGTWAIFVTIRRVRTPPDLRGDWWSEFEREFRSYATRSARHGREDRRHRGERA